MPIAAPGSTSRSPSSRTARCHNSAAAAPLNDILCGESASPPARMGWLSTLATGEAVFACRALLGLQR